MIKDKYANTFWTIEDIKTINGELNDKECHEILLSNESKLVEAMVKAGWDFLEQVIN